ncbi:MAG TPA: type II toxin-antitoxin system Phd/YefM family antitoxin [Candidatus Saccharimonadales bacterium]|nr:type II toxin-antitoxin system Phd/YefM family antitoxin [Candidatus Saccharimonadales bacterium]
MLDIRPVSDLRNDFADIEKEINDNDKPIIFTKNGRGSMVLMSLDKYSKLTHLGYIEQALDEADAYAKDSPENLTHDEVFSKLRAKING